MSRSEARLAVIGSRHSEKEETIKGRVREEGGKSVVVLNRDSETQLVEMSLVATDNPRLFLVTDVAGLAYYDMERECLAERALPRDTGKRAHGFGMRKMKNEQER